MATEMNTAQPFKRKVMDIYAYPYPVKVPSALRPLPLLPLPLLPWHSDLLPWHSDLPRCILICSRGILIRPAAF